MNDPRLYFLWIWLNFWFWPLVLYSPTVRNIGCCLLGYMAFIMIVGDWKHTKNALRSRSQLGVNSTAESTIMGVTGWSLGYGPSHMVSVCPVITSFRERLSSFSSDNCPFVKSLSSYSLAIICWQSANDSFLHRRICSTKTPSSMLCESMIRWLLSGWISSSSSVAGVPGRKVGRRILWSLSLMTPKGTLWVCLHSTRSLSKSIVTI